MDSHRSWFPTILIGLSVALAAMIFAVYQPGEKPVVERVQVTPAPTSSEYQAAIAAVLSPENAAPAQSKLDTLTQMRVPAEELTLHLQLVFVFNDYVAGNMEEGDARLGTLRATYTWLP